MNFGVVVAVVVVFVVVVVSYRWVADLNVLIVPDLITFFRAFKAVIGNLDELRKKDYGDEERGARRLESWLWKLFLSFSVYLSETELLSLKTPRTTKGARERDFIFSANFFLAAGLYTYSTSLAIHTRAIFMLFRTRVNEALNTFPSMRCQ